MLFDEILHFVQDDKRGVIKFLVDSIILAI